MFEINDRIYFEGRSLDVKQLSIEELKKHLVEFQKKEKILIDEQNRYLSEVLRQEG